MSPQNGHPAGRQRLGDIEIVRELGRGGMGIVYEARRVSPIHVIRQLRQALMTEQITARRTPLDHRTDLYSLGATLDELLTRQPHFADDTEADREHLGQTPIYKMRLAWDFYRSKLEKPGYETVEGFGLDRYDIVRRGDWPQGTLQVQLDRQRSRPQGMVRVSMRPHLPDMPLRTLDIALGSFVLDRYEVTNRQFKKIVERLSLEKAHKDRHNRLTWFVVFVN